VSRSERVTSRSTPLLSSRLVSSPHDGGFYFAFLTLAFSTFPFSLPLHLSAPLAGSLSVLLPFTHAYLFYYFLFCTLAPKTTPPTSINTAWALAIHVPPGLLAYRKQPAPPVPAFMHVTPLVSSFEVGAWGWWTPHLFRRRRRMREYWLSLIVVFSRLLVAHV